MGKPKRKRCIDAAIAIISRDNRVLICQRKPDDTLGGFWEFPGGKQERGETLHQCLARELQEELAIKADPLEALPPIEHDYPKVMVRLHPFLCKHAEGEPQMIECQDFRWIEPVALRDFKFPPANTDLIELVIKRLSN